MTAFVSSSMIRCEAPAQAGGSVASVAVHLDTAVPLTASGADAGVAAHVSGGAGGSNAMQLRFTGANCSRATACDHRPQPPLSALALCFCLAELPSVLAVTSTPGGSSVTVRGSGFAPTLDGPWCRVGTLGPLSAEWLGPSHIVCPVPHLAFSTTARSVQVSNNGADFASARGIFLTPLGARVLAVMDRVQLL